MWRSILSSVGALLAGTLVAVVPAVATDSVLSVIGLFPKLGEERLADHLLALATAYRLVFSVMGSYVAAWLAPDHPMRHALVLGIVGTVVSVTGAAATWDAGPAFEPKWYPLALVAIALPSAWGGGRLCELHKRGKPSNA